MGWHLLLWGVLAVLASLWSLLYLLLRSLVHWTGWKQGVEGVKQLPSLDLPPWLMEILGIGWIERFQAVLADWAPEFQAWVQSWPDVSAWLSAALVWGWGLGLGLLALAGLLGSVLIRAGQRLQARTEGR
ncbi:hypothetical protein [Inhella gelatinilytica]|uniref:Uncharacterized protein n=1 Tax=Inhella gelatinilytica TaxID=2795030 RepID=A0A931NEK9_9BURK|nr:hypothetical protein [Inhella gelatinilytica]MBH9554267.1 hypothetical protein [Inhella gelatinilytica]